MPRPGKRTRSKKRVSGSLPGGRKAIHYKLRASSPRFCYICKQPLGGIGRLTTSGIHKLSKSERRIWRPYGGQICHNCLKDNLKQAARQS